MKHIRITARPDLDGSPSFVAYLLDSPEVGEARAIDRNRADADTTTHLYAIDGDAVGFQDAATDTPGVEAVTLSAAGETISYALLDVLDDVVPMFGVAQPILNVGVPARLSPVVRGAQFTRFTYGNTAAYTNHRFR